MVIALERLQIDIEAEKSTLARTLHDELGGLLLGVIMDMEWMAGHPGIPEPVKTKLARAKGLMRTAIYLERELIENLRPTLLENVGLYSTLRWYLKASCEAAAVPYTESLPASEQALSAELKTGVFRIVQEALQDALVRPVPLDLSLCVEVKADTLHCHLIHRSAPEQREASLRCPVTSMHHRARRLGGNVQWSQLQANRRQMHLQVPLVP